MAVKKPGIRQEIQVVGFYLGEDEYAIFIHKVREIYAMTEIRKVPKAPQFVEGVINLRGTIVPIIDLRKRFELDANESKHTAKILIVELGKNLVGMIVDNVSEVMRFYTDEVEKAPPMFASNIGSQYVQGVAKLNDKLIILLDIEKLLSYEEQSVLKSFKS
ncbi:MAG: CheW protein [uncultured bacterium]|nr:MAG: CheW protein [uncultured bacterium]